MKADFINGSLMINKNMILFRSWRSVKIPQYDCTIRRSSRKNMIWNRHQIKYPLLHFKKYKIITIYQIPGDVIAGKVQVEIFTNT